ncbi:ribosome maturation factor RimM [sulfur-oxidizing endosymbiont of Gigantopelta aegis]|uniref:ribosome maturation factor RimM n=1 Tax=sulfur-oxidizing endosymbiont of Gigantopelta aegis TaxID=2794934 RepID=UPI0018DBA4A6|nr:ribosome maturation factor RimM [sulfur-oxidizing endosymbiont of Gigantopelta aegis]
MSELSDDQDLHILGKISGYYGVKGWVKIYSYTQPRENIVRYKALKIKLGNNRNTSWQDIQLDNGKAHGKGVVAHFSGYDSREISATLIGAELAVQRSEFKAAGKDEYYWTDLIGLKVSNLEDVELGKVSRLIETAVNDVLVIESAQDKTEILVPFVLEHYVKKVTLDEGKIIVDWPIAWNEEQNKDSDSHSNNNDDNDDNDKIDA